MVEFLLYYLFEFLMTNVFVYCFGKLINKKIEYNFKTILLFILITMVTFMNNLYNIAVLKIIIATITIIVTNYLIFKVKLKDTIFYTLIYVFISLILELITSTILLSNMQNIDLLNDSYTIKITFSTINMVLQLIIFNNNKIIFFINKIYELIIERINFYSISMSILLILNILIMYRGLELDNKAITMISGIFIIFMLITIKTIVNDKNNIKVLKDKNQNIKDSNKAYAETIEDCRELKHNLKNDLYSLKATLPKDSQEKLNNIIIKYNKNYEWINDIDEIPEGIQGLIYLKIHEAEQKKIKIHLNTKKLLNTGNKDYLDLCNIIGILIDNAIESSEKTTKKIIEINIKELDNELYIKIYNQFTNNIDINKIGKKNYSTKEFKSGIGLNYIKKLNNNNINLKFEIINDIFITKIKYILK